MLVLEDDTEDDCDGEDVVVVVVTGGLDAAEEVDKADEVD